MMRLKYQREINSLSCNLDNFSKAQGRHAFCWVFEPITNSRNFKPRALSSGGKKVECNSWALSFFESEQQAKSKLKKLMVKTPNLYKILGTHIAEGILDDKSGISEKCNSHGHFNHHESDSNDFSKTFNITGLSYK